MHLGHHATADGRWRIFVFADAAAARAGQQATASPVAAFAEWIATASDSPLAATPEGADRDAWFDVKVIYPQDHTGVDIGAVPAAFKPNVGPAASTAAAASSWWCARASTWPASCP